MIEFCMEGDSLKPNPKTCCHPRLQDRPSSFAFCSRIYAFHPGHHLVCHRHSLASQELGLASAFLRQGHSSHLAIISLLDEKTAVEDNRVLLKIQFRFFHTCNSHFSPGLSPLPSASPVPRSGSIPLPLKKLGGNRDYPRCRLKGDHRPAPSAG